MTRGSLPVLTLALAMLAAGPPPAAAQMTITDALSFLLTNRSIPTGDFAGDEVATRAADGAGVEVEPLKTAQRRSR